MKHFNELIEDYINVIIHEQVHNQPKADRAAECLQGYVLKRFCDELRLLRKFQNTDKIDTVARYIALLRNDNSTWENAYDKYMSYFHNELTF